ncbi:hypothetical protein Tco_0967671 [Tanacetum coccineum]
MGEDNVADEAVNEEMDDSLERAATTATSLDAEQDRGNIDKTQSKETLNEPSSLGTSSGSGPRGNTLRSGEDRLKLKELIEFSTKLQQSVLDLENIKTAQAQEITSLKLRVKKLEKKGGSRTHKLKRLYKVGRSARMVSSDDASLGDQEDASKQGRKIDDIDKVTEITLIDETQRRYGDDLMFDTGVLDDEEVFAEQNMDEKRLMWLKRKLVLLIKSAKSKVKGVMIGEQSESTTRTRPQQLPSKDKAMIDADYQMAQQMQAEEQEKLSIKERNKLFKLFDKAMKRVNTFVDMDTELVKGSEQEVDEDKETTELQRLIEVVPDKEEVAIDAIPLATKPPSIMYLVFSHMLKSFDIEDLETLWKLVKAKHGSTRSEEGYERVLWGDLKIMFDPHVEDQVWRNQQDYRVLDWKIYDSCGVHSLRIQHMYIHMLVEKRYPLTPATITDMLNKKLQCDHFSKMVYQLLKLLTKQLKNQ